MPVSGEADRAVMDYPTYRQQGWPIGSGSVESANKRVMQARLTRAGMRWERAHVNPMLALRTAICNERWDESWQTVRSQRFTSGCSSDSSAPLLAWPNFLTRLLVLGLCLRPLLLLLPLRHVCLPRPLPRCPAPVGLRLITLGSEPSSPRKSLCKNLTRTHSINESIHASVCSFICVRTPLLKQGACGQTPPQFGIPGEARRFGFAV